MADVGSAPDVEEYIRRMQGGLPGTPIGATLANTGQPTAPAPRDSFAGGGVVGAIKGILAPVKSAIVGPPLEERYAQEIAAQAKAAADPNNDMIAVGNAQTQLVDRMLKDGYTPRDTRPIMRPISNQILANLTVQPLPANMDPVQATVQRAQQINALNTAWGRTAPGRQASQAELLRLPGQINVDVTRAGANRALGEKYQTQTGSELQRQQTLIPSQVYRNVQAGGASGAEAGLRQAQTTTETTMLPFRQDLMNAQTQKALTPGAGGNKGPIKQAITNPVTGKPEMWLFDQQGNPLQRLETTGHGTEIPQHTSPLDDVAAALREKFGTGGGAPAPAQPPRQPLAAPTAQPKVLTPELAAQYLEAAGGDKDAARAAARADGYTF